MKELNPNHPVTREVHDHWHKLCALVMFKLGVPDVEITSEDMNAFTHALGEGASIACHPEGHVMRLFLVNGAEAAALARKAGGLPV